MSDEMRLEVIRRETAQAERLIAQTGDFMGQRHIALVSDLSFLLTTLDAVTRERDEAVETLGAAINERDVLLNALREARLAMESTVWTGEDGARYRRVVDLLVKQYGDGADLMVTFPRRAMSVNTRAPNAVDLAAADLQWVREQERERREVATWRARYGEDNKVPYLAALAAADRYQRIADGLAQSLTPADADHAASLEVFTAYFTANYPSGCVINDPWWHAPKVFRAALRALEADPLVAPPPPPPTEASRGSEW